MEPSMQTLLLIPTRMDMKQIFGVDHLDESPWPNVVIAHCGLGQILTAMHATRLLMLDQFDRCLLAGLAGTYVPDAVAVGNAVICRGFHQYGFGFTEDGQIRSYSQTVIKQLVDMEDYIPATWVPEVPGVQYVDSLSVMSASGDLEEAESRHDWFDQMSIEEMEGFSAALACNTLGVPFGSVRGVCNIAGDRNHSHWEFEKMGHAVHAILKGLFS
jgi:nucleoside phosphorylase